MQDKDTTLNANRQDDISQIVESLITKKNEMLQQETITDEEYQRFIDEAKTILKSLDEASKEYINEIKAFNENEKELQQTLNIERQKREALIKKLNEVVNKEQQRIEALNSIAKSLNTLTKTVNGIKSDIDAIKNKQSNLETLLYIAITISFLTLLALIYLNWR